VTAWTLEEQLRWLESVAKEVRPGGRIDFTLSWENEHGSAGVLFEKGVPTVFLGSGQRALESVGEVAPTLRGIFADEIVAVTAFDKDMIVFSGLASASDPSASLPRPGRSGGGVPNIDDMMIETWSGGLQEKE
jgi:hypothetical protein